MPKSPEEMAQSMIENMPEKTGKSLQEWLALINNMASEKHGVIVKHLKSEHGVTHGFANLIAHKLRESDAGSVAQTVDLVAEQYSGAKADLRPIYDNLMSAISKFGSEVEVAPKKAYVSLRRKKQFAIIQPSTKTRVDVGINLKGRDAGSRLEASGSFNAMVSHRVRLSEPSDVDDELIAWLQEAYDLA